MSTNPFAAPQTSPYMPPPTTPAFKPIERIQYLRMYNYIFENPNWMTNVLLGGLCGLIPVVGPLVMLGYQFEIVIALLQTGGTRYPDFDFNRFSDYLMRGLWPFLVQLVAGMVLMVPVMILAMVPFFVLMGLASNANNDATMGLVVMFGFFLWGLFMFLISVLPAVVLLPMQIRAGLEQDFGAAFNFGWVLDFIKKTWVDMLMALLFLAFTATLLVMLGYVACFVGVFFALPIVYLAQAHFQYEVYLLFLSRGGQAIPIKLSPSPQQAFAAGPPPGYQPPR